MASDAIRGVETEPVKSGPAVEANGSVGAFQAGGNPDRRGGLADASPGTNHSMADLVRALTRLFHWGSVVATPGVSHGPDTAVARRLRNLLASRTPATAVDQPIREVLLPSVKHFITEERARIAAAHRRGTGGLEVVGLHTELVDAVICELFRLADAEFPASARERADGCAVVALGGYGRRELNPGSDVDVMVLYPRNVDDYVNAILAHVLYLLWDLGFTVGHSCRSLSDAQRMMGTDLTARTAMLEARLLAGHPALFAGLQERIWRAFQGRRAEQYIQRSGQNRSTAIGSSGGPSTYRNRTSKKGRAACGTSTRPSGWPERGTACPTSPTCRPGPSHPRGAGQWLQALDFLLRVRTELHHLQGSKDDVLTFSLSRCPWRQAWAFGRGPLRRRAIHAAVLRAGRGVAPGIEPPHRAVLGAARLPRGGHDDAIAGPGHRGRVHRAPARDPHPARAA